MPEREEKRTQHWCHSRGLVTISNVFTGNYRPSIVAFSNTDYRLARNAYLDDPGDTPPQSVLVNPNSPSTFWSYGNYVTSVNINKYVNDLDWTVGYAIGWTQNSGSGYSNYAVKSTNLNSSLNLNSTGKDMQLHNGWDFSTMHGVALSTSSPYAFQRTGNVYNGQIPKAIAEPIASGRTLVVSVAGLESLFYFTVGDISASGTAVEFPSLSDTTRLASTQQLFNQLISEPFAVNSGSSFIYGVEYGVTDSAAAISLFRNGGFVAFRLDLIDAQTGQVVNTLNQVQYDSVQAERHARIDETVDTKAKGNQRFRLRLSIATNLSCQYALGSILVPSGPALAKGAATRHEIDLERTPVVTQYSLSQNYPNPFNPTTQVSYQLAAQAQVILKVYDLLGQEVATLVDATEDQGQYSATVEGSRLSSGIYFLRLNVHPVDGSAAIVMTRKIVLMK